MEKMQLHGINSDTNITFDTNDYFIDSDGLQKRTIYVSNNDVSEKSIAFELQNKKNIVLDFSGSKVIFNGRITPFVIENCENITIKNIVVDYDRPFFSQGAIVESKKDYFVLKFDSVFSYRIENSEIIFTAKNWEENINQGFYLFQEYDTIKKCVAYNAGVALCVVGNNAQPKIGAPGDVRKLKATDLGNGFVKFSGEVWQMEKDNTLIITHEKRLNNIILAKDSKNLHFENITIKHSGSMGIICQCCEDIYLDNIQVRLDSISKGMITTNCDATHFVNCSGKLNIKNSTFENMLDDGVNIHGIYTEVNKIVSDTEFIAELMHYQQYGVNVYKTGDKIIAYHGKSVKIADEYTVISAEMLSEKLIKIKINESTSSLNIDDHIENRQRMPEVSIDNCTTGKNRPRGFLISTSKSAKVTNCKFNNAAFGIHIAGDTTYWFESGGVENVLIENNIFEDCGYQMGDYAIGITPEYLAAPGAQYFHKNIIIKNNIFKTFTDGIVYAEGVSGLTVSNNKYIQTNTYKKRVDTKKVNYLNCINVVEY